MVICMIMVNVVVVDVYRLVEYLKNEDDEAFRKLESIEITPEQRRSQMADRARYWTLNDSYNNLGLLEKLGLPRRRLLLKSKRRGNGGMCLMMVYMTTRMNCDELRGLESAAITKEVFKARGEQQTMVDAKKKQEQQGMDIDGGIVKQPHDLNVDYDII